MSRKFISKGRTASKCGEDGDFCADWFKKGTEVELLEEWTHSGQEPWGLFRGIRVCDSPESEARQYGEEYMDEETCTFEEFDIIEDEEDER